MNKLITNPILFIARTYLSFYILMKQINNESRFIIDRMYLSFYILNDNESHFIYRSYESFILYFQ